MEFPLDNFNDSSHVTLKTYSSGTCLVKKRVKLGALEVLSKSPMVPSVEKRPSATTMIFAKDKMFVDFSCGLQAADLILRSQDSEVKMF